MTTARRPALLAALAAAALPRTARAQAPRRARIGFLSASSLEDPAAPTYLRRYLAALGWREGETLVIEDRYSMGDAAQTPRLAAELVALRPEVIVVTGGSEARAVAAATRDIPVVFLQVVDPVGSGLIESLARPGGNMTGAAAAGQLLFGKRIELLRELLAPLPVRRVALLANPNNPITARGEPAFREQAAQLGVAHRTVPVTRRVDIAPAIAEAATADAVLVQHDFVLFPARREVAALLNAARRPAIYENRFSPLVGGLCSYGADLRENFRQGALYVDRILRGARPADLPVVLPSRVEFVVNAAAAVALGLAVPPGLLARADEVID